MLFPQPMKHCRWKARNLSLWLLLFWSSSSKVQRREESWSHTASGGISEVEVSCKTPSQSWAWHFSRADQIWRDTYPSSYIQKRFMTVLNSIQCGHHTSGRATAPNFRIRAITASPPQGSLHICWVLSQASFPGRLLSPFCELLLEIPSAWLYKICSIVLKKVLGVWLVWSGELEFSTAKPALFTSSVFSLKILADQSSHHNWKQYLFGIQAELRVCFPCSSLLN